MHAMTTIFFRISASAESSSSEKLLFSNKVRWGHAHSVLESWTDLALDDAGVDHLNLFDRSFLHGLEAPDHPDLFEGNGLEGDDRPSRCDP